MTLRVCFLEDHLFETDRGVVRALAPALERPFPDFTLLTEAFVEDAVARFDGVSGPGVVGWESNSRFTDPAIAAARVIVYRPALETPPAHTAQWATEALQTPGLDATAIVVAPKARLPELTEALRPALYVSHPYRSVGELKSFANQLVSDGLLFSEGSALGLPLITRPTPLGRMLRTWVVRFVLKPLGWW